MITRSIYVLGTPYEILKVKSVFDLEAFRANKDCLFSVHLQPGEDLRLEHAYECNIIPVCKYGFSANIIGVSPVGLPQHANDYLVGEKILKTGNAAKASRKPPVPPSPTPPHTHSHRPTSDTHIYTHAYV